MFVKLKNNDVRELPDEIAKRMVVRGVAVEVASGQAAVAAPIERAALDESEKR